VDLENWMAWVLIEFNPGNHFVQQTVGSAVVLHHLLQFIGPKWRRREKKSDFLLWKKNPFFLKKMAFF